MLKSYSYLKEAGVYVQEDGETEGDAIRKVVGMEEEARRAKKEAVRKMRESLMRGNVEMVAGWIEMVRVKMGG